MNLKNCEDCTFCDEPYVDPILVRGSDILFIGEAPTREGVKKNKPIQGLEWMLLKPYLMRLKEKGLKVSITNGVLCRPPKDRAPTKKEYTPCIENLEATIKYVNPKLIVCLGGVALGAVTGRKGVTKLNGRILWDYAIPVAISFHPAYVVHNKYSDDSRKKFEEGMLSVQTFFDEEVKLPYKVVDSLPYTEELVGMDIENRIGIPQKEILKCVSMSNGKKALFAYLEEDKDGKKKRRI